MSTSMHGSRKKARDEEVEEEENKAGCMAAGPAATLWQWMEDAVRLLWRTVGYGDRQREPTYTELLLEQLSNWTSELGLFTIVCLGATWLLVKLGSKGNPSRQRVTSSTSSEHSKVYAGGWCPVDPDSHFDTTVYRLLGPAVHG